jgi:hypothetical protein
VGEGAVEAVGFAVGVGGEEVGDEADGEVAVCGGGLVALAV